MKESEAMTSPPEAAGQPLLSVIVPVYNVEPYLRRALDSICEQSYRHLEIICVDDGSPDHSLDILREYAARDSRIRIVSKPNGGLADARNAGIAQASGEWVTGIDPDDYLLPNAYRTAMALATDEVDMVVFGVKVEAEPGSGVESQVPGMEQYVNFSYEGVRELDAECLCHFGVVFWNKLYRRSLLEKHQLRFDARLRKQEDYCFHMRYCAYAHKAAFCRMPGYAYILRGGSISFSSERAASGLGDFFRCLENVLSVYSQLGLVEAYVPMLAMMLRDTDYHVRKWSLFIAQPLEWRRQLLDLIRQHGLQEYAELVPTIHELTEQLHAAARGQLLLQVCALPAQPREATAGEGVHVAIPTDEAHAASALLLAQGLVAHASRCNPLCLHVICENVSPCTREALKSLAREDVSVHVAEVAADVLNHLPPLEHDFPRKTWLKMALPWVLPGVERVLVLTPGLLATGALPPVHAVDMAGMPVAVLPEFPVARREWLATGLKLNRYVSSDVVLLNLEAMRNQGGAEAWMAACLFCPECSPRAEADSFNLAFHGRMADLPAEWLSVLHAATPEELRQAALVQEMPLLAWPLDDERVRSWLLPPPLPKPEPESSSPEPEEVLAGLAPQYGRLRCRYYRYKILSLLSWGKRRRRYQERCRVCKVALRRIRRTYAEACRLWGV